MSCFLSVFLKCLPCDCRKSEDSIFTEDYNTFTQDQRKEQILCINSLFATEGQFYLIEVINVGHSFPSYLVHVLLLLGVVTAQKVFRPNVATSCRSALKIDI